jgi:hypothetical protein
MHTHTHHLTTHILLLPTVADRCFSNKRARSWPSYMTAAITTSTNENDEHRDYLSIRKVFFRGVVLYFIKPSFFLLKMIRSSSCVFKKEKQIRSKLCTDTSLS